MGGQKKAERVVMSHFATALIAGVVTTVLVSGVEAAKMSAAERAALEKRTYMQGGSGGHEIPLALAEAPEIRPKLHHKVC
jgi:hypothetical protein